MVPKKSWKVRASLTGCVSAVAGVGPGVIETAFGVEMVLILAVEVDVHAVAMVASVVEVDLAFPEAFVSSECGVGCHTSNPQPGVHPHYHWGSNLGIHRVGSP